MPGGLALVGQFVGEFQDRRAVTHEIGDAPAIAGASTPPKNAATPSFAHAAGSETAAIATTGAVNQTP